MGASPGRSGPGGRSPGAPYPLAPPGPRMPDYFLCRHPTTRPAPRLAGRDTAVHSTLDLRLASRPGESCHADPRPRECHDREQHRRSDCMLLGRNLQPRGRHSTTGPGRHTPGGGIGSQGPTLGRLCRRHRRSSTHRRTDGGATLGVTAASCLDQLAQPLRTQSGGFLAGPTPTMDTAERWADCSSRHTEMRTSGWQIHAGAGDTDKIRRAVVAATGTPAEVYFADCLDPRSRRYTPMAVIHTQGRHAHRMEALITRVPPYVSEAWTRNCRLRMHGLGTTGQRRSPQRPRLHQAACARARTPAEAVAHGRSFSLWHPGPATGSRPGRRSLRAAHFAIHGMPVVSGPEAARRAATGPRGTTGRTS